MSSAPSGSTSSGIGFGQGHPDFGMSGTSVGPVGEVYGGPSPQEARANMRARQAMWDKVSAIREPGYFHKKARELYDPIVFNMALDTPKETVQAVKNLGWIAALPAWDKQVALQEFKEERMRDFEVGHPFSAKGLGNLEAYMDLGVRTNPQGILDAEPEMDLGMRTGILGGDQ
tara:strand:+ start:192 stop:710 length:519 start_codon:yes stop_codon:yes gene_type:complete